MSDHSHSHFISTSTTPPHFVNYPLQSNWQALMSERPRETVLERRKRERVEAREEARINHEYELFDAAALADLHAGTVVTFWRAREDANARRLHAALYVDARWFVTGGSAPNGVSTEDFIAWLIEHHVHAGDLTVRVAP